VSDILPGVYRSSKRTTATSAPSASAPEKDSTASTDEPDPTSLSRSATLYAALHLLNPLVFTISTRGSSEALLSSFVLLALYAGLKGRWAWAGALLGLGVHWKIYPVVYGVGCLGVVGAGVGQDKRGYLKTLVNWRTVRFAAVGAGTYVILSGACYLVYVPPPPLYPGRVLMDTE
jgi:phosphatidylinositol glycan class M